eukprot:3113599-Pleurochrysis_carterae.AAC.1
MPAVCLLITCRVVMHAYFAALDELVLGGVGCGVPQDGGRRRYSRRRHAARGNGAQVYFKPLQNLSPFAGKGLPDEGRSCSGGGGDGGL